MIAMRSTKPHETALSRTLCFELFRVCSWIALLLPSVRLACRSPGFSLIQSEDLSLRDYSCRGNIALVLVKKWKSNGRVTSEQCACPEDCSWILMC
jgi:hypothetical protein